MELDYIRIATPEASIAMKITRILEELNLNTKILKNVRLDLLLEHIIKRLPKEIQEVEEIKEFFLVHYTIEEDNITYHEQIENLRVMITWKIGQEDRFIEERKSVLIQENSFTQKIQTTVANSYGIEIKKTCDKTRYVDHQIINQVFMEIKRQRQPLDKAIVTISDGLGVNVFMVQVTAISGKYDALDILITPEEVKELLEKDKVYVKSKIYNNEFHEILEEEKRKLEKGYYYKTPESDLEKRIEKAKATGSKKRLAEELGLNQQK